MKRKTNVLRKLAQSYQLPNSSKYFLILETVVCSGVVTVMPGLVWHFCNYSHVRGTFHAGVRVVHFISSESSFGPFLGSWFFPVKTLLSFVHPVNDVIVIVLPEKNEFKKSHDNKFAISYKLILNC